MVQRKTCKARKTLKNAALVAKIGAATAENEQKRKKMVDQITVTLPVSDEIPTFRNSFCTHSEISDSLRAELLRY